MVKNVIALARILTKRNLPLKKNQDDALTSRMKIKERNRLDTQSNFDFAPLSRERRDIQHKSRYYKQTSQILDLFIPFNCRLHEALQ